MTPSDIEAPVTTAEAAIEKSRARHSERLKTREKPVRRASNTARRSITAE